MSPSVLGGLRHRSEAGFSMVEMLMAAFILAIGILGLSMLQTMSLKLTAGSRGLSTAVLVAERVMDEIEANGRNTLLYVRSTPAAAVGTLDDVFLAAPAVPPAAPSQTYNFSGRLAAGDPIDPAPFFRVYIQPTLVPGVAAPGVVAPVTGLGGIANMTVLIQWVEDASGAIRQVVLTRRVAYATV